MSNTNKKLLIMDVDGTLTDGLIYMSNSGELMKAFNVKDGYAIANLLPLYNIVPVIVTSRTSQIVQNRCNELGIHHLYQGIYQKEAKLDELLLQFQLSYDDVFYIGDDINDLNCMKKVKCCGCPSNAAKEIKAISHFISSSMGGHGAVREFIEWIITNY